MLTAPSHQSDDNWNKALQGNFNYNFLRDLSVPLPLDGKNKIIVLIGHLDGMGDFAHGLEFAKMVTLCTKEKGYEVVGAVVTCVDFGSEQQSKALKKAVSENRHIFDELYLFDQDDPIPEDLKKSAGKSACMLTVSFDPFIGLFSYLPPKTIQIRCLEFGSDSRTYIRDCDFDNANMGLNLNQAHCNGILLKEPPKEEPLHLMASIKNKDFVTALVCGKNYDDYLRDHVFIPGYLQCSTSATVFIVSNVLRFFDHGELKKSCDFFLPSHMIEEKSILAALCALGLSSSLIQFITPESSERELIKTSTISIFSGFNLDDDDYSKLYYLQSDVAGCSGDNTTALVLSSNRLPYFQNKCGPLGHFYSDLYKFVHFIEKQQEHDPKSQHALTMLQAYLRHNLEFDLTFSNIDGHLKHYGIDEFIQQCRTFAQFFNSPEVHSAWNIVRTNLKQNYNYRNIFPNILKGALCFSRPVSKELISALAKHDIFYNLDTLFSIGFINDHMHLSTRMLIVLGNPKISDFIQQFSLSIESFQRILREKKIDPDRLGCQTIHNIYVALLANQQAYSSPTILPQYEQFVASPSSPRTQTRITPYSSGNTFRL